MNNALAVKPRKKAHEKARPVSISLPQVLLDRAGCKARLMGFGSLSSYFQDLARRDLMAGGNVA